MDMCGKWMNKLAVCVAVFLCAWTLSAQTDGTYSGFSPYSVYGVGQLHQGGTAWNRGMGGVGIATRNKRFVNLLNPAAVTARDTLSFMSDFGLSGRFSYFSEGNQQNVNTLFNIDDFVISFPLWAHSALMVGVTPYSDVGYKIAYTEMDAYTGQRSFATVGTGGLYQAFVGGGVTLWNRLSLGAQFNYVFGNINKAASKTNDDTSYRSFSSGDSLRVHQLTGTFGLQYEQPIGATSFLTLGATYRLSTNLTGEHIHYREIGSYDRIRSTRTLENGEIKMGDQLGVGLSFRNADNWSVEVDYLREDWSHSGFETSAGFSNDSDVRFVSSVGQSFRAGFEFTPNRNDIRYYLRRCTYRLGAYYDQSYYTVNGAHVDAVGLTLGMTLPVFRWYNGVTVGVDLGRRGLAGQQVKETYAGFNIGFNVFDIWFKKPRYE